MLLYNALYYISALFLCAGVMSHEDERSSTGTSDTQCPGQFLQLMMRQGSSWAIGPLPGSAPVAAQRAVLFRPTRTSLSRFASLELVSRRDPHPGFPVPACHNLAAVTLIPGGRECREAFECPFRGLTHAWRQCTAVCCLELSSRVLVRTYTIKRL